MRNVAARSACGNGTLEFGSRSHCQRKYHHHSPTWSVYDACRSDNFGLPYWPRLKLYLNASYVALENVHDISSFVRHAVGSPSFIAGKCAARMGCVMNGVPPTRSATAQTTRSRQRRTVAGLRINTAKPTACAGSILVM